MIWGNNLIVGIFLVILWPVIVGIITGIMAGFYSGSVVFKLGKFWDIQDKIHEAINRIDTLPFREEDLKSLSREIPYLAASFYRFGHEEAGNKVNSIGKDICSILEGNEIIDIINEKREEWLKIVNYKLTPNWIAILNIFFFKRSFKK